MSNETQGVHPSPPLRPALTPEEWKQHTPQLDEYMMWAADEAGLFGEGHRAKLAALALHGQAFGFTWDDVDAIHMALRMLQEQGIAAPPLRMLADRIAALLPPRVSGDRFLNPDEMIEP